MKAKHGAERDEIERSVARVLRMEALFDLLSQAFADTPEPSGPEEELLAAARELSDYLSGGDWLRDFRLDEEGLLPAGLKRGVLSEDGLYDLLCSPEIEALLSLGCEDAPK